MFVLVVNICTITQICQLMHSVYQEMCKNFILGFLHHFFPFQIGRRVEIFIQFPRGDGLPPLLWFFFASLDYISNLSFGCISFLFRVASAFEFDFPRTDTIHPSFKGNMAVLMHWDPSCDYLCTIGLFLSVFFFAVLVSFSLLLLLLQFDFTRIDSTRVSFNWNFGFNFKT